MSPNYGERERRVLQMMSLDSRKAAERYIETHGLEAFERVIQAVRDAKFSFFCYFFLVRVWSLASSRRIRIQDYRDFVFDKAYIVFVLRLRQIRLVQALTEAKKN